MAQYLPRYKPGHSINRTTSADVTGGRLVEVSGSGTVAHAAADSGFVLGVAGNDTKSGDVVLVHRGGVQRPEAAGAIPAKAVFYAAADGKIAATGTKPLGFTLTAAAAAGDRPEVVFGGM